MDLTLDSLKYMVAELQKHAPPKRRIIVSGDMAYILDDIPDPYFVPLEPPRFKPTPDDLCMSVLYGWKIMLPEKFACVVYAGMALSDARPERFSLRYYLRRYGHRKYALVKRRRREQRHQR